MTNNFAIIWAQHQEDVKNGVFLKYEKKVAKKSKKRKDISILPREEYIDTIFMDIQPIESDSCEESLF